MKKTGLFKIIMFVLLGIVVATWIFSAGYFNEGKLTDLGMYNIGFFDYFQLLFGSFEFSYFIQIFILLVSIGALYGVLGKTGKYRAFVEKIASNLKGREMVFIIITAFIIAALTAVFDYGFAMFIFYPFVISIILAMGYDKTTACLTTFGAQLVGTIGGVIAYNINGVVNNLLELELGAGLWFKLALFVLSFGALIFFLSKAKKGKRTAKAEEEDMFLGEKATNKYSVAPIIVIFSIIFVLLVLGCTAWEDTFGVSAFKNFNDNLAAYTIKLPYFHLTINGVDAGTKEIAIFSQILGTVSAFGEWYYAEMAVMCLLSALVLGLLYRVKDKFAAMAEGAKKMLRPALLIVLIYCVIYFAGNTMFFPTLASLILGITSKFNIFFSTIVMALASAVHVDMLYVSNYAIPQLAAQDVNPIIVALLAQGIYGVVMFVAPTSAVLALGLSYLDIPYKEWVKNTWKLILALFAIVVVVLIASMIIL